MPAPLAVLFDFDGVLADTANVHIAAWERTFAEMGIEVAPDACVEAAEVDDRVFFRRVLVEKDVDEGRVDVEGWVGRKLETCLGMLRDEPRLYAGATELIQHLAGTMRLGVVSTAWRAAIDTVLEAGGVRSCFEVVVAKEDVARTKPDPEPYLVALRRLGLGADDVVALEDSPTGLRSAGAAGVRCVAVGQRRAAGEWSAMASGFVADLSDPGAVGRALGVAGADLG